MHNQSSERMDNYWALCGMFMYLLFINYYITSLAHAAQATRRVNCRAERRRKNIEHRRRELQMSISQMRKLRMMTFEQKRLCTFNYIMRNLMDHQSVLSAENFKGTRLPNKVRSSDWWSRIVNQHFTEEDWLANFRMSKGIFEILCNSLADELKPSDIAVQEPLPLRKKVAIVLYKLASCAEYRVVANNFGVHKSTVCTAFYAVVKAINKVLTPHIVRMPTQMEAEVITEAIQERYKFPQAFGAIDGTHIPVLPPEVGYRDFINRKGWPSVVLQGLVDNQFCFRDISCLVPGSSHDARALSESWLYNHHEEMIPQLPRVIDGVEVPLMILGDAAYPLLPWLMKGYTGHITPEQESFNVYLSASRMAVEIAFGRLKARWRCLLKRIDVHYMFVPQVISACCTLHNLVEKNKDRFVDQWLDDVQQADILYPQPEVVIARDHDNYNMHLIRDHLCKHLAHTLPLRRSTFQPHFRN